MKSLFCLVSAVLAMSLKAVAGGLLGAPHRYLPAKVRMASPGFISLMVAFFVASMVRYVFIEGQPMANLVFSQAVYLAVLVMLVRRDRCPELAIYLAASVGIDLVMAGLGATGVNTTDPGLHLIGFAWEWIATISCVVHFYLDRRAQRAADATGN